jgi:NADH dehydrogenase
VNSAASALGRVIVTGGTGYVGCHLVDALVRRSVPTTVIARTTTPTDAKEFVRSAGATVREVDYAAQPDLSADFAACSTWFHLIGSVARLRHDSFEHRHRVLTERLVDQATRAGVGRMVMLTALGTSAEANNAYHRTKAEAERVVVESGIAAAIVRPGLICGRAVGPRNSKLVQRYIDMIRGRGRVLILGDGRNRVQPIDVRDAAECMIRAAEKAATGVAAFDVSGPEPMAFREFVGRLAEALGQRARTRHVPLWLAGLGARALEVVQEAPALTREQVALARIDNTCPTDSVERAFGFRPRGVDESLRTYSDVGRVANPPR